MKKINVIYATKTKHSKKIADKVAGVLGVTAQDVVSSPAVDGTDLLFIVGGIYGGESLPELKDFVSGLSSTQVNTVALITSSASNAKGQDAVRSILEGKGIPVVDECRCFGAILFVRMGHPNKTEVESAAEFAARLAKTVG